MDTAKLSAFIAVADAGSLSRAARSLGAQLSTVSRQITDLEATLGAALLIRTGRGVRLTPAGERFLERARHVVRELDDAAAEARGDRGAALSRLRLSTPLEIALRLMPGVLAELSQKHPRVQLDVHSDARRVSLLEEDYDAAVRLGPLKDSELVARALGGVTMVLCASPAVAPRVRSAADLASADFALVAGAHADLAGTLRGRAVRVQLQGTCRVSTFTEAAALAAASSRLVALPSFTAAEPLASGRLVRVLPALSLPRVEVQLVHARRHRGAQVLRHLGDLLSAALTQAERSITPPPEGAGEAQ
jgi:DNA-binding transcriptional LysR family regulator